MRSIEDMNQEYKSIVANDILDKKKKRSKLVELMDEMNVFYGLHEIHTHQFVKRNSKLVSFYKQVANSR